MQMAQINLNDYIKVKLTDFGKDIYYHQYDELNKIIGYEVISPKMPKTDADGKTEMPLWEFIHLYGNYIRRIKRSIKRIKISKRY